MLDKLKISRGFTVPCDDNESPCADAIVPEGYAASDRPVVILWAEDWERIRAVVEAAIEHHDDYELDRDLIAQAVKDGNLSEANGKLLIATHDLRAHMEASDGKG